jgi:hypothetical protein
VSPVDLTNSSSASESDETSDDDSVKYDTIKLAGRRRTVVPNTTGHNNTCVSSNSNSSVPLAADLLQLAPSLHHTAVDEGSNSSSSPPAVSRLSPSAVRRSASPGAAVCASTSEVTALSPTTKYLEIGTDIIFIFFIYQRLCCRFVTSGAVPDFSLLCKCS